MAINLRDLINKEFDESSNFSDYIEKENRIFEESKKERLLRKNKPLTTKEGENLNTIYAKLMLSYSQMQTYSTKPETNSWSCFSCIKPNSEEDSAPYTIINLHHQIYKSLDHPLYKPSFIEKIDMHIRLNYFYLRFNKDILEKNKGEKYVNETNTHISKLEDRFFDFLKDNNELVEKHPDIMVLTKKKESPLLESNLLSYQNEEFLSPTEVMSKIHSKDMQTKQYNYQDNQVRQDSLINNPRQSGVHDNYYSSQDSNINQYKRPSLMQDNDYQYNKLKQDSNVVTLHSQISNQHRPSLIQDNDYQYNKLKQDPNVVTFHSENNNLNPNRFTTLQQPYPKSYIPNQTIHNSQQNNLIYNKVNSNYNQNFDNLITQTKYNSQQNNSIYDKFNSNDNQNLNNLITQNKYNSQQNNSMSNSVTYQSSEDLININESDIFNTGKLNQIEEQAYNNLSDIRKGIEKINVNELKNNSNDMNTFQHIENQQAINEKSFIKIQQKRKDLSSEHNNLQYQNKLLDKQIAEQIQKNERGKPAKI